MKPKVLHFKCAQILDKPAFKNEKAQKAFMKDQYLIEEQINSLFKIG